MTKAVTRGYGKAVSERSFLIQKRLDRCSCICDGLLDGARRTPEHELGLLIGSAVGLAHTRERAFDVRYEQGHEFHKADGRLFGAHFHVSARLEDLSQFYELIGAFS
jgi:hypothetical protein